MNQYALTGASFPLNISGKEFEAFSLTDRDYTELDAYIQAKVMEVARLPLDDLSNTERSEMLQAAIKAAASTGWGTPEGSKIMNTTEGVLRLGWQHIKRKSHVTFDEFVKLAEGKGQEELIKNLLEIDKVFLVLNGAEDWSGSDESKEDSSKDTKSVGENT